MSQYIRHYQPGGHYFFTLVTHERRPIFSNPKNVAHLKCALLQIKKKHPFSLNALIILPDHLHCLWKLPQDDQDFSTRWRLIKRHTSMGMKTIANHRNEKKIWQPRFWEHTIRDIDDWHKHLDYIHYNPVKHGLVKSPADWKNSSFHYWVSKGIYAKNWCSSEVITFSGMDFVE